MRGWAIKPVKELRRHLVGAERMVGPEQKMLRTEHLVATGKRLVVIAHGVNIKVGEIVAHRSRKARRFGDERGRAGIGFDAAGQSSRRPTVPVDRRRRRSRIAARWGRVFPFPRRREMRARGFFVKSWPPRPQCRESTLL